MSGTTITTPPAATEVLTVGQAALLIGRDEKTVRRYLPTTTNEAGNRVRLPNAYRDGAGPNAPWLIPVGDLVAAGLCAPTAPAGSATGSEALARQRDDRELARLREDLATCRADNLAKSQLLADRDSQIKDLHRQLERMYALLGQALTARAA